MKKNTEARRLKLLQLEGNGLLKQEIVKELTAEYDVCRATIYNDFNTRRFWQQVYDERKEALLKIINRHEQSYRKASLSYLQANNNREKQQAIYLLKQINKELLDIMVTTGLIQKVPEQIQMDVEQTTEWQIDPNYIKAIEDCKKVLEAIKDAAIQNGSLPSNTLPEE